jgi:ribosomal protein L12E/L44/L45/RPP1/RPP2
LRNIIQKRREQKKGKRAVLKGQFHISTEELRSQVAEAEAATAAATASQRSRRTPRLMDKATIEEIDEESEEEPYDSDVDELGL